jgi:hypothetical protein
MNWILRTSILFLTVALGCSSISINSQYSQEEDFSRFKTYDWMDVPESVTCDLKHLAARTPFFDKTVKKVTNEVLAGKGFQLNSTDPQLFVVYHACVEDKVEIIDWGYTAPRLRRSSSWPHRLEQEVHYKKGSLVLDFVDAKQKELVWRGIAEDTLGQYPTREDEEKKVFEAIQGMLQEFPPPSD